MAGQPTSWVPSAKVAGGGVAGAVTTIVLWALEHWAHLQLPTPVAAAAGFLVTVAAAYWIPGAKTDDEPPLTEDERAQIQQAYRDALRDWRNKPLG